MRLFGFEITRASAEGRSFENPKFSLDDPRLFEALGIPTGSVSPRSALGISAVYACVRILAESVACLPIHVYRRDGRSVTKVDDLAVAELLRHAPNSYQSAFQFREWGQSSLALRGNFYAEIQRNANSGEPLALHPLDATEVAPRLEKRGNAMVKTYRVAGEVLSDEEVFHVPALGWNGIVGLSPITLHRWTMSLASAADEFGARFYQNSANPSGVLEHPGKLSPDAATRLRQSWTEQYAGPGRAGKTLVLEEGMKFHPITIPLADAEFIATRKYQVADIARIFRVPPHMVGDLERATFSNIEQQSLEFVIHSMMPWLVRWEQECNRKLLTSSQRRNHYVRFNVAGLLRGDVKSRYEAYKIARESGWLSVNEIRESEDLNPVAMGDGYIEPMNFRPLGEKPAPPPAPAPTAQEPAPTEPGAQNEGAKA